MIRANKKMKMPMSRVLFIIFAIIVPLANFLIFYVYVNSSSIVMAFQVVKGGKTVFSFDNFTRFFSEFSSPIQGGILEALENTLFSFVILQVMFPIGMLTSFFIYKKIMFSGFFRYVFFLPGLLAPTIVASFYMKVAGVGGPIAPLFQNIFNLEYEPTLFTDSRFANLMIFINMIWLAVPGNIVMWSGAFSRIPDSMIEAAQLDGVTWVQEIVHIIIPAIWPTFSMLWLLSFSSLFAASGQVFLLTKGESGTMTLTCWLYLQIYNNKAGVYQSGTYNYLSAVGLLITIVSMIITIMVRKLTGQNKATEVGY